MYFEHLKYSEYIEQEGFGQRRPKIVDIFGQEQRGQNTCSRVNLCWQTSH